jgi:hypothetical protein
MRMLLSRRGMEALQQPIAGRGEAQHLLRKLQGLIIGNMVMLSPGDMALLRGYGEAAVTATEERAAAVLDGATEG